MPPARLRLSVEQGIIEFKRTMLSPVLVALETARYKSLDGDEMIEQERTLSALLFSVLVQRLAGRGPSSPFSPP